MRVINFVIAFFAIGSIFGCSSSADKELKSGTWRATLSRDNQELPLLLEISQNPDKKSYTVFSVNGEERLQLDSAYFENDSLHIPMQLFDSEIVAALKNDKLSGSYNRLQEGSVIASLPFQAVFGENYRFFKEGVAKGDKNVNGKWLTVFLNPATGDSTVSVGNFIQKGNQVQGSFLTPTGDYRFLNGNINGDSLFLSTFDGSNAMLFKAVIQPDGTLKGEQWSGVKGYKTWTAKLNPDAKLPDATKLTFLKPGFDKVNLSFPDSDGKTVSLSDPQYKDKVVIIQILGSWCPNCMDETNFLAPWYDKNKDRGVEIIGLAFERSDKPEVSNPKIKKMINRFGMNYPVLLAGTNSDEATAKALPMLNKVMSYPTTIFIDKKGKVREIHTGFSGPGTGEYYDQFVEEFNGLVSKMIAEK
ncbi:peroxiredoxin [Dyadobacter sp. CY312]|uniref:peroxiredoxin family protein n=1 Tax=Dyadobacter sp. CY312 TaxID=2907303 RepID=UPI001F4206BE|nr:TlpA disulfide reductase family protein [Dyadobacter sp. CY312]MCE7043030.1 TlpA family protein disulfide reductase [Dyadobacter sp. CY312]